MFFSSMKNEFSSHPISGQEKFARARSRSENFIVQRNEQHASDVHTSSLDKKSLLEPDLDLRILLFNETNSMLPMYILHLWTRKVC